MKIKNLFKYHISELVALLIFLVGSALGMLGLIQKVPLAVGILGIVILATGLFFFCIRYTSEKVYKDYYKDSYEIEHETIEEEIRQVKETGLNCYKYVFFTKKGFAEAETDEVGHIELRQIFR